MKTRAVSKYDFFECATPNAPARRILREKLQRFRRRKFEKSTPQMQKIICRQPSAHFETQHTAKENANAIARRAQRRMRAILNFCREKLPRFRRRKFEKSTPQTRNFDFKIFLRSFEGSARRDEDDRRLQLRFLGMRNAERARSSEFCAENCRVFDA